MNRSEFQALARSRLQDAAVLFAASRFDGAYYLFGLAVECGLKACICLRVRRYDFPDRELTQQSYQHDLFKLVRAAGLEDALDVATKADAEFGANWLTVAGWSVESRYWPAGQSESEKLRSAVFIEGMG